MAKDQLLFPDISAWGFEPKTLLGLSRPWQKLFARLPEINSLPINEWKPFHLLSHFLYKFNQEYKHPYALSFKGSPLNCEEIVLIKRMMAVLSTDNFVTLKAYIDWFFDTKVVQRKFELKKISVLLTPGFGNEFLALKRKKDTVTKTSKLPAHLLKVAEELFIPVETYGDLSFIVEMVKKEPERESYKQYKMLMNKFEAFSFDFGVLEKIK